MSLHEAKLYYQLRGEKVRCYLCERRCIIEKGERGLCRARCNIDGKLFTLTYGNLSAVESRPIEIKPFFHFWPGSSSLTFSTWGCNFNCPWCQNWQLSRGEPRSSIYIPPHKLVSQALYKDAGVCVSFNEPLILFEYSLDVFKVATDVGLYCTYVSNGYMSIEALTLLREAGLNGLKIDVKGASEEYGRFNKADVNVVWRNAREAKNRGIHVEIVYLVIPGATDREETITETIERHVKELGPETPIHFTRYYPAYLYNEPPTPIKKLEWCYNQAKKYGVLFPYLGNVPGHPYENTYCPECGELLIKRYGYQVLKYVITADNYCPRCNREIPIVGSYIKRHSSLTF